jgi:adenosylhomocysteine nucleosidase
MKRVLVTAAVRQELSGFEGELEGAETLSGEGGYLRGEIDGVRVQLYLTGVGAGTIGFKLGAALDEWKPDLLIAAGFCGGLTGLLRGGDVILAERVLEPAASGAEPGSLCTETELLPAAEGVMVPESGVQRGVLLTVPDVVCSAKEKRELGSRYGADGIDMESFAVLATCREKGVPCIIARSVFDEAAFELPRGLEKIPGPDGKPRLLGVIGLLIRRPWAILRVFSLGRRSSRAAASLAAFITGTLRALQRGDENV